MQKKEIYKIILYSFAFNFVKNLSNILLHIYFIIIINFDFYV